MRRRIFVLFLLILVSRASMSLAADSLDARIDAALNAPGYAGAHWGLLVADAKTGQVVYQKNADQLFCPASVTKVYSTAAAIADLGIDYRFKTPIVRKGDVGPDGTLRGDLILVASGDLSLGGRTGPDGKLLFEDNDHSYAGGSFKATLVAANPRAGLEHLAREVKDAGITSVTGEILVDDRLFEAAPSTGSGPSRVSPIVVNDNVVDVVVTPGAKPGDAATVKIVPETAFVAFDTQVETTAESSAGAIDVVPSGPRRFIVRGKLPVGHRPVVKIYEVEDPASFARAILIEALRAQGVKVSASALSDNSPTSLPTSAEVAKLPEVAAYTSPPLAEYIKVILKVSQNLHASTLPLLIAAHHGEKTLDEGLKREGQLLKSLGVDIGTIAFGGGAGGARADLVTPRATVGLLQALAKRPDFPAFDAALPILGRDGTLAQSVSADSPARGHARAKTGTYWVSNGLNGQALLTSKALAGYIETSSGRPLVFAFFVNNVPLKGDNVGDATAAAGKLLGKLCEVFYAESEETRPAPAKVDEKGK